MKRGTPEHPKMKHLARSLRVNHAHAVGLMETLWHWAGKFAQQGDVGRHDDRDIADACYWTRNPKELIDALIGCGWLDKSDKHRLIIHDWHAHADDAVKKYLDRNGLNFLSNDPASALQSSANVQTVSRQCPDSGNKSPPALAYRPSPEPSPTPSPPVRARGPGIPITVDDAIAQCVLVAVPKEFVMHCFDKLESRGGGDGGGVAIQNFPAYVRTQWKYEQDYKGRYANNRQNNKPNPRNAGLATNATEVGKLHAEHAKKRSQPLPDGLATEVAPT